VKNNFFFTSLCKLSLLIELQCSTMSSCFDSDGELFALVSKDLDRCKLRVSSIEFLATKTIISQLYELEKGEEILSTAFASSDIFATGKRSKSHQQSLETKTVAIGLNTGKVLLYSPANNDLIATLESPSGVGITDFHFCEQNFRGYAVDLNGKIHEFDLKSHNLLRSFTLEDTGIRKVSSLVYEGSLHLVLSSNSIYIYDLKTSSIALSFPGHVATISNIVIKDSTIFSGAEGDRFVNCYSLTTKKILKVVVFQSPVVTFRYGESQGHGVLIGVTEDGNIELFNDPLATNTMQKSSKRRRQVESINTGVIIDINRPEDRNAANENMKFIDLFIKGSSIIVSWMEGLVPVFDTLSWVKTVDDFATLQIITDTHLVKDRVASHKDQGLELHDSAAPKLYTEKNAVVTMGDNFKDLEVDQEDLETFGDQLKQAPIKAARKKKLTTDSLATVLTQALKSNDHSLLESVLNNRDENVIKKTISRLDSIYVVNFLDRLSERILRNANKQTALIVWIKWVMIIHGNYLMQQPNLFSSLSTLYVILSNRSKTLPKLLQLQGRVNMVLNTIDMRKSILQDKETGESDDDSDLDEDVVEYVEEVEDGILVEASESEDEEMVAENGYSESDDDDF